MSAVRKICCLVVLLAVQRLAAGRFDDFVIQYPGPCVRENETQRLQWESGRRAFAEGNYLEARRAFLAAAADCPDDTAARHMAALASLSLGETAQGIRWLVQLERLRGADACISFAIAAAHTNAIAEDIVVGWLKRGMQRCALEERAYWVTRPAFSWLWSNRTPAFVTLLEEFGIPAERMEAAAQARPPSLAPPSAEPAPEPETRMLRLSFFDSSADYQDKSEFMKRRIELNMIKRIRDVEVEPAEFWTPLEGKPTSLEP